MKRPYIESFVLACPLDEKDAWCNCLFGKKDETKTCFYQKEIAETGLVLCENKKACSAALVAKKNEIQNELQTVWERARSLRDRGLPDDWV